MRARDWITGDEKWQAPYIGEQPIYVQALAAPLTESVSLGGGLAVDPADHWLLRPDADGTVHVIDARTGAELAARQGTGEVAPNQPAYVPYAHTLYTIVQESPARVIRHDLDRTDPPTEVYASTGERVDNVAPCGVGRLCVLVSPQVVGGTRQLVVLDEVGGRELWRAPVLGNAIEVETVDDRILVSSGDLFTLDGQPARGGDLARLPRLGQCGQCARCRSSGARRSIAPRARHDVHSGRINCVHRPDPAHGRPVRLESTVPCLPGCRWLQRLEVRTRLTSSGFHLRSHSAMAGRVGRRNCPLWTN